MRRPEGGIPRPGMIPLAIGAKARTGGSMTTFADFLATAKAHLADSRTLLRVRRFASDHDDRLLPNEVYVGVGPAAGASAPAEGISLNNKRVGADSVTDMVIDAPPDLVQSWIAAVAGATAPSNFFERFCLVTEDASPDSCFGVLALLARLNGVPAAEFPTAWIHYIRAWERGDATLGTSPSTSYGCIHDALVHGHIEEDPTRAWLEAMRLLVQLLAQRQEPLDISTNDPFPALISALALLDSERQIYEDSLRHTTPLQLAVPMRDLPDRSRLVDAYIADEVVPIGSLKVFARNDRTHSFLKRGFSVMAIHRPGAEGSGNDMTISADTRVGIEFRELWTVLEAMEDKLWAGARPCDSPRDIVSYRHGSARGQRSDGTNSPNEPWWDDHGRYSLLAAPMRLASGGSRRVGPLGSKLGWPDVLEALWTTYQPFRHVKLRAGAEAVKRDGPAEESELRALAECFPDDADLSGQATYSIDGETWQPASGLRLYVAGWYQRSNTDLEFRPTPTLCRYLAACIDRPLSEPAPIRLRDLPSIGSFTAVEFASGLAVITNNGAFVLDAGRSSKLPIASLQHEFYKVAGMKRQVETNMKRVTELLKDTQAYVDGESVGLSDLQLLHRLSLEQIKATLTIHRAEVDASPQEARQFRRALLTHWSIDGRLEGLAATIGQVRELFQSHADLEVGRGFNFLQTYGLPLVVAASLFGSAFAAIRSDFSGINWASLAGFAAASILGIFLIRAKSSMDKWRHRRYGRSLSGGTADS